ncbi:MAG: deoxyribodipyrimidine photo-lyase [Sulfuricurvum sp.]|uniref:cryptochrome/photolyase family protein n=1 Tax=Sulfuricurvum sp. TaxID=2025608 RepID=UPI0026133282|nr:deoxyribodipyrimidine photo-lyase [Sulfuricurvum sp.]MDD5160115.1 deoxyribodipyrimidine photo-lyase [Sulfuricurvum sp.]
MRRILWFRRDLRVEDNPLLSQEGNVLPIFIFDTDILEKLSANDRRVSFIFNALIRLKENLKIRGLDLALFYGKPTEVFQWFLAQESHYDICASGDYDPYARERDREVSHILPFTYLHDTYIFKPDEVLKNDGSPYLVFTPYYNRAKAVFRPEHMAESMAVPQSLIPFDYKDIHRIKGDTHTKVPLSLTSIGFFEQSLSPHQLLLPEDKLKQFASKLGTYPHDRDFMALNATSRLSTDLRFGTISIRAVIRWLVEQKKLGVDTEPFFRQLIFREFYAMLLAQFPRLVDQNFRYPFRGVDNNDYFEAFCTACTGVPIVDAGIRELLGTGEMHNRVRMICASFFTKNLLLPWQWGERFFAEHLMDYDAASNILSWQWSAGTGVDPQPYFRIFNPYTQSAKFDKEGLYIKKYLPDSGCEYPKPIVDHKQSSKRALEYFKNTFST